MANYSELPDNELVQLLNNGDEIAFSEIYGRYWNKMMALAYSHTKDRFAAEEVVQDLFLSVWTRRETINVNSLKAYLATAVKFSIFKSIFNKTRRERILGSLSHEPEALADEILHAKFLKEYVDGIVEQLPDKCRLVYVYSRDEGLPAKAIANEMGIAEKTVEAHLTKALKFLRINLKDFLTVFML